MPGRPEDPERASEPRWAGPGSTRSDTSSGPEIRRGYLVFGRVQGVGFRWWTTRTARELGLVGTVRNRADGAVELHVRGPRDAIDRLEERLHEGPSAARVREVKRIEARDAFPEEFRIIR